MPNQYVNKVVKENTTLIDITDTTAVQSDVSQGKYFYLATGQRVAGTSSGGGASNIVTGTFTTGSTRGSSGSVTIGYSGSGYPIACLVYIDGGPYNNGTDGNTDWYNSTNRYDCGFYSMVKSRVTTAPDYSIGNSSSRTADEYGTVSYIYKGSTSNATTYTRSSSMSGTTFGNSSAGGGASMVLFNNATTMRYYVGKSETNYIGFPPSTKMAYTIIYSS